MSDIEKTVSKDFPVSAQTLDAVDNKDDVAANFLAKMAREQPDLLADWSPQEEKRLVRWKIE